MLETAKVGISLGLDCLPATWGVHSKFRESKENNYKTCPFDLMISNFDGIIKCIVEDFKNFTNPAFLVYDGICIRNTYYNFMFNHETPGHANLYITEQWKEGANHFINNKFKHFIDRYNARIKNFRDYLNNKENFINFIFHPSSENNNYKNLKSALLTKYPLLQYKIIIINGPMPHNIMNTVVSKVI